MVKVRLSSWPCCSHYIHQCIHTCIIRLQVSLSHGGLIAVLLSAISSAFTPFCAIPTLTNLPPPNFPLSSLSQHFYSPPSTSPPPYTLPQPLLPLHLPSTPPPLHPPSTPPPTCTLPPTLPSFLPSQLPSFLPSQLPSFLPSTSLLPPLTTSPLPPPLAALLQEWDEPVLEHLRDVRIVYPEEKGFDFILEFHFADNEYFTNKVCW